MSHHLRSALIAISLLVAPSASRAQVRGGFIARLGADTMHVEQFVRDGRKASGVVVMHAPVVRISRWSMTYDDRGLPSHYEVRTVDGSGAPVLNGYTGSMTFLPDSIVREGYAKDTLRVTRMSAPRGANPYPPVPYFGVSYLMYEDAFAAARRRISSGLDSVATLSLLTVIPGQPTPNRTRAWVVSADSAELDYFGVARSGWKFDAAGALIRADWTGTTYKYRIDRLPDIDVEAIAAAWGAQERVGAGVGTISPRDSVKGAIDTARLTIDYSRPAMRGRRIWGDVVPWDRVWRLGADFATHFTTSADIMIGGTLVPAGRYTLWMLPSETTPMLIVNSAVNVFGTNYDPRRDFARIPLTRSATTQPVERLTLGVRDGALSITWADVAWSVPVRIR